MRHLPNDNTLPELRRVLNLMQEEVDRLKQSGGAAASPDALTRAGAMQARYGSAGVLLTQLQQLADKGILSSDVFAKPGDGVPTSNVLTTPTITPKLTRHGEFTLTATDTLSLDSRGYAVTIPRLIREVP